MNNENELRKPNIRKNKSFTIWYVQKIDTQIFQLPTLSDSKVKNYTHKDTATQIFYNMNEKSSRF